MIGYAKKTAVNTLQFPPKPKKPVPPFFQFMQEKRLEVIGSHNLNIKGTKLFNTLMLCRYYLL